MSSTRENTIRAMCERTRLEALADDLVDSALSEPEVGRVLLTVTALQDQATDTAPTLPDMTALEALALPAPLLVKIRTVVAEAVGDAQWPRSDKPVS